jgi:hypothetical protein
MFNPLMGGSSINNIQPKGARSTTNENSIPGFSLNTTGGADMTSFNYGMPATQAKDTPANVNTKAIVARVGIEGGSLNPSAMAFLSGPHPESAFV